MRLNVNKEEAKIILEMQLKDFANRAKEALELFQAGKEKEAYQQFPHDDFVGENLEEYVND